VGLICFSVETTADLGMDPGGSATPNQVKGHNKCTGKIENMPIDLKKMNAPAAAAEKRSKRKWARTTSTWTSLPAMRSATPTYCPKVP